jgi:hypothetical protein
LMIKLISCWMSALKAKVSAILLSDPLCVPAEALYGNPRPPQPRGYFEQHACIKESWGLRRAGTERQTVRWYPTKARLAQAQA